MITSVETLIIIAVAAVCTFLTRALPFMIFKNAEALPKKIVYLGKVLPMAIMLCLIVYCVRNTAFCNTLWFAGAAWNCWGCRSAFVETQQYDQYHRRNAALYGIGTTGFCIMLKIFSETYCFFLKHCL